MKTTICAKELRELEACEEGYNTFYEAHGESVVKLSEALESNGLNDVFWLLELLELTKRQEDDLHLLACDYAEVALPIYEEAYPTDSRPRKAVETKRLWVAGEASDKELKEAEAEAEAAAWAAEAEAEEAAWAATWAADMEAAEAATRAVEAAEVQQEKQLKELLLAWEK